MIKKIAIDLLKPHPKNEGIYGSLEVDDLIASIQEFGFFDHNPIVVNPQNQILSGHRRYLAACQLDLPEVPVLIKEFEDEQKEVEFLLAENIYRTKTNEQKIREGMVWETIEKEKAKKRRLANLLSTEKENLPDQENQEKGATRDIVGKLCQIGSGSTYAKGKKIVQQIDWYVEEGKTYKALELREILNKSVDGAYQLLPIPLNTQDRKSVV